MSQDPYRQQRSSQDASFTPDNQNDLRKVRSQPVNVPPAPLPPDPVQYSQSRKRGPSNAASEASYSQPVRDAVNTALNADQAAAGADPNLIAQITEQVLRSLNMQSAGGQGSGRTLSPQPTQSRSGAASPNASVPPKNIYTSQPPEAAFGSPKMEGMSDIPDDQLDGRSDRPSTAYKYGESPESPTRKETYISSDDGVGRPQVTVRKSTGDATTLEKIWQPLFDPSGRPTERLGQFLRGLALHIIDDYEPKRSIVISPPKMLRFYEEVKLPEEVFPWSTIFGGKITNSSLSHLYRDLRCQHHFVQNYFEEKPQIPALTPLGFERWMIHFIRSYPDMEFERFAKAVLDMPISNADNPRERFPKQLSRRLFPKFSDDAVKFELEEAMVADELIQLNRTASASQTSNGPPTQSAPINIPPGPNFPPPQNSDGDARAFSSSPSDMPPLEEVTSSVKIERERQPYYAAPGQGRQYHDGRATKSEAPPGRSNTTSGTRPNLDVSDEYLTRNNQHRRTNSQAAPPLSTNMRSNLRQRSPSINGRQANPYSRSESAVNSNSFGSDGGPTGFAQDDDDQHRYTREDRSRRYVPEDQQRYYPGGPVPPPQQSRQYYDDEYYRRATVSGGYPPGYMPQQQQQPPQQAPTFRPGP